MYNGFRFYTFLQTLLSPPIIRSGWSPRFPKKKIVWTLPEKVFFYFDHDTFSIKIFSGLPGPWVNIFSRSRQNENPSQPPEIIPQNHPFFRLHYLPNPGTYRPLFPQNTKTKPKMSPVRDQITPCSIENSWIFCMKRGSGKRREIHVGFRRKDTSFLSPKRGFLSSWPCYPPSCLEFRLPIGAISGDFLCWFSHG